jgi:glycosyltransferase involved in cell wall biosynthesis
MPSLDEQRSARATLRAGDGSIILFIGHLQERKAVDRLLQGFRLVLDELPETRLLVVGGPVESSDGKYFQRLKEIVKIQSLANRVIFCGPKDDVLPYLFAANVFCLPSHREGMPNVLLEAMACGLACVAPATAGGDELLNHSSGVIPPSNSPHDLALALTELLDNPVRCTEVGTVAAARVASEHRPELVALRYANLLTAGNRSGTHGTE